MTYKAPDLSPEAVERLTIADLLRQHHAAFHQFVQASDYDARVDALIKERDEWREEWSAEADGRIAANTKLRTALARLGAVQRETLEKAASLFTIPEAQRVADRIRDIPLDPDAAAALERALEAEREACAEVANTSIFYPDDRSGYEASDAMQEAHAALVRHAVKSYPGAATEIEALAMLARQRGSIIEAAKRRFSELPAAILARGQKDDANG